MNDNFYKQLIEESPTGYAYHRIICDEDGIACGYEFIEVNAAFEKLTGLRGSDIVGKRVTEILPEIGTSTFDWIHFYGDIAINGGHKEFENFSDFLNKWNKVNVYSPEKNYFITAIHDITESKIMEESLKKSEEEYRLLFENAVEAIVVIQNREIQICNPMAQQLTGYSEKELTSMPFLDLIYCEDVENVRNIHNIRLKEEGYNSKQINRLVRKDKEIRWIESNGIKINWKGKEAVLNFVIDVTEREQAEEALQMNQRKLMDIIDFLPDATLAIDKERRIIIWNKAIEKMTCITASEMIGKGDNAHTIPFYGEARPLLMDSVFSDDEEISNQYFNITREGDTLMAEVFCPALYNNRGAWILVKASPLHDQAGNIIGAIESIRDITDRKRAEEALIVSELRYRRLFETAKDGILILDAETGQIKNVNPFLIELLGYSEEQFIEKAIWDIGLFKDIVANRDNFLELKQKEYIRYENLPLKTADGRRIAVEFVSNVYSVDHQKIIQCNIRDITDRKRAEDALQESENLYRTFIDASSDMIYLKDDQLEHLVANKSLADFFGKTKEKIIGKSDFELMPKSAAEKCRQADMEALSVKSAHVSEEVVGNRRYETIKFPVKLMNNKTGVGGFIRDITERKQAEIELKAAKDYLEKLFSYSSAPIIVWNENFEITKINGAFETLIGRKASEILGKTLEIFFPPYQASELMSLFVNTNKVKDFKTTEIDIVHVDGSVRTVLWNLATIYDQDDINSISTIAQGQDITERKNAEKNLSYLSYHDHLTGLYNRRYFEEEEKRLDMESQLPVSIIMGDINGVKLINDAFGHAEGDKLIVDTAKIMHSCCRGEDVLARTGGDDFSILLPKTDSKTAYEILEKIQTICKAHNSNISNEAFHINISLGYCTKETVDQDFNKVIKTAEAYMYQRKLLEHKSSHSAIIASIRATMLEKNQDTQEHAERLTVLIKMIGMALNLSQTELNELELLATLHDIGKVGIDERILNKPGKLSEDEWVEIKKHPEIGYRIAMSSPELIPIAEYIFSHHERWDGKGYPQGLIGRKYHSYLAYWLLLIRLTL